MTNYDPIAPTHGFTHLQGGDDPLSPWDMWPIGGVMMYDGDLADVPDNWSVIAKNRVPVGAGDTYATGDTGGNSAFTHASAGNHDHGGTLNHVDGAVADHASHTHSVGSTDGEVQSGSGDSVVVLVNANTGGPSAVLTHSVTQPDPHELPTEGGHTHDVHPLPAFYALYFLKRMS